MKLVRKLLENFLLLGKTLSQLEVVSVLLIVLAGVRWYFVSTVDFPLNDGGFFYAMIDDLVKSHFVLPCFTSYNHAHIPFAYPPLAFYIGGVLVSFFHIDLAFLLQYLPAVISVLLLLPYYRLTLLITKSSRLAVISLLLFGLTPRSFEWIIMGGGFTRSFGFLFSLSTLYYGYRVIIMREKNAWWAISFLALTILSHAEWAVFTIYSLLVLILFRAKARRRACLRFLFCVLSAVVVVSPWWGVVLARHGLSPFLSAMDTRHLSISYVVQFLSFYNFAEEPLMPIMTFLGLLGALGAIGRKDYLFPAWIGLVFLLSSLSRGTFASILLPILGAYGVVDVLFESAYRLGMNRRYAQVGMVGFLAGYLLVNMVLGTWAGILPLQAVSASDRQVMSWVRANVKPAGNFLVLSAETDMWTDEVSEWFPALADQHSVLTVQGAEWIPGFLGREKRYGALQKCEGKNLSCVEWFLHRYHLSVTHIFLSKTPNATNTNGCCQLVYDQLKRSQHYTLLYENSSASVWRVKAR